MSTDHHWGPRLQLFLEDGCAPDLPGRVSDMLSSNLPVSFLGYSTNFSPPDLADNGTRLLEAVESGPVNHMVTVTTLLRFIHEELGVDPYVQPSTAQWLTFEEHRLLALIRGRVFYDGLGSLEVVRQRFAWYPHDLWLYLLAAEWAKIGQEEPFVGRCGSVGDDLGSRLVAARLVHSLMRLVFLMEKQYPPYSKWFGTAFMQLAASPQFQPHLAAALDADAWEPRQQALGLAYEAAARLHNTLRLTPALPEQASMFFERPFVVIHGEVFAGALRAAIQDENVRRLPPFAGSINQFIVSVDVLTDLESRKRLQSLYTALYTDAV
jgi:hypothetical protein